MQPVLVDLQDVITRLEATILRTKKIILIFRQHTSDMNPYLVGYSTWQDGFDHDAWLLSTNDAKTETRTSVDQLHYVDLTPVRWKT